MAYFSIASVGNSEVRGWSSSRLAFEPRDWQVDLRAELRKRITALSPEPGWLVAELYTVDASHYDVENALLYNVGPSAFAGLTHRGLAFRGYAVHPSASPEALTPVESAHPVLVRYAVRHSPPSWFSGSAAGRLSFRLPKLSGASKPHDVWLAASLGSISGTGGFVDGRRFALKVHVSAPRGHQPRSVANMLKPLLDGIICALHLHLEDGTTDECCARLGRATGRDTKEIRLLLCNRPSWTPLGATRLLHPFGRGVQWNPSDHLCAAAVVELDAHDHSDWIVTTEAYADAALTPAKQLDATP